MDQEGFRSFLKTRRLSDEKIEASIKLAEIFEGFLASSGTDATTAIQTFCRRLIQDQENTYDNLLTLARYGLFTHDYKIYVAVLELLDGAEAQPNLYQKVAETFGERARAEVFAGIGLAPLGIPATEKPAYMLPVIDRLIERQGEAEIAKLLSDCLRDLPDVYYRNERRKFRSSRDFDHYLQKRHRAFVREIRKCQREGRLFFSQEITDQVVEFVKNNQEIESGVREGSIVYVTKIPYNAKQYLAESDPTLKRYYACHCPWAREAVRSGHTHLNAVFCNCSGGFTKKPFEIVFKQKLQVEVLESVLQGDLRCRFAIHLPEMLELS